MNSGYFDPVLLQQVGDEHRGEAVRVEIDEVHPFRRVAQLLLGRDLRPQARLPRREEHGVVVAQAVDGARAQARHDAHEAVLAVDARRPAELVEAERHAAKRRQEVAADLRADHFLDHDAHLLVEIKQAAFGAVLDGVRAERARIDLGDRVAHRGQPVALAAAVREEQALVLPREGRPDSVLQQAGASDDERLVADVVESDGQALHDLLRQLRVLERLDDVRVFLPDLLDLEILAVVDVLQVVVVEERQQAVRRDVPRLRHLEAADGVGVLLRPPHDVVREQEAGALAPQLAARAGRRDHALHDVAEVVHVQIVLRRVDVLEVVGQEAAHERHAQPDQHGTGQLLVRDSHALKPLEGVGDLGERRALVLDGLHEEPAPVVLHPLLDDVHDLVVSQVAGRDAKGRVRHAHQRVAPGPLEGAVFVRHLPVPLVRAEVFEQVLRLVDAGPHEVVDHPARDARQQVRVGAAQEIDDHAPVAAVVGRRLLDGVLPVPHQAAEPPLGQELAQAHADVIEQPALFLEERSLVGLREVRFVKDLDRARRLAHHEDRRAQHPRRFGAVSRLIDARLDGDLGPAGVGVLPARRDDVDQIPAHLVRRTLGVRRTVQHLVETDKFLGPLEQQGHQVERAVVLAGHGYRLLCCGTIGIRDSGFGIRDAR